MAGVRIVEDTRRYKDLIKRVQQGSAIRVGVLGSKAGEQKDGAKPGVTVLDVATWNEFGTTRASDVTPSHSGIDVRWEHVPPRPFIGGWFDAFIDKNKEIVRKVSVAVVKGLMTKEAGQALLGSTFVGQIRQRIADGIKPANAPSTIRKKGSDKPLIDTGQLRSAIAWEPYEPGGK